MELKEAGLDVGELRVGRLMRINGIRLIRTRKHKVTTDSHHRLGVAANWLDGDFVADAANRKWAGDITYVWTSEGWLYLAVVLDLHSRRVVGWAVSDRMKKDLAIRPLDKVVRLRNSSPRNRSRRQSETSWKRQPTRYPPSRFRHQQTGGRGQAASYCTLRSRHRHRE